MHGGIEGDAAPAGAREQRLDAAIGRWSPYVCLAIGLALTPPFLVGGPTWPWVVIGVLTPLTVLWCAVFTFREPERATHPVGSAVYLTGLLLLTAGLVRASPLFAFLAAAVYIHAFAYLRGNWRFVAVVLAAVPVGYAQVGGRLGDEFTSGTVLAMVVLIVANAVLGGGSTYFGVFLTEQNQRLSETLDENAVLHAQLLAQAREAGHGAEALARAAAALVDAVRVDVVLMDLRMPTMGGVEAIGQLRRIAPDVRVLVLTTYDSDTDVVPAIEAGATGYLLKDTPRDALLHAVRAAHRGEAVLSPAVAGRLMGQVRRPAADTLSAREVEVLRLVAAGSTNRETARRPFISEATVKTHLLHIYAKLEVRDRASAVAAGYQRGLLTS